MKWVIAKHRLLAATLLVLLVILAGHAVISLRTCIDRSQVEGGVLGAVRKASMLSANRRTLLSAAHAPLPAVVRKPDSKPTPAVVTGPAVVTTVQLGYDEAVMKLVNALRDATTMDAAREEEAISIARALASTVLAAGAATGDAAAAAAGPAVAAPSAARGEYIPPTSTSQTCYLQTDESELCVYDGAICYDGTDVIVAQDGVAEGSPELVDPHLECSDARFDEPSAFEYSHCVYQTSTARKYPGDGREPSTVPRDPVNDFPLPLSNRQWGPNNRGNGLSFRPMPAAALFGASAADVSAGRPANSALPAGMGVSRVVTANGRTVSWVDGALWLGSLATGTDSNGFMWFPRVGMLYDALRHNVTLTHPNDGALVWRDLWQISFLDVR
jgi:hypothetical protein